MRGLMAENMRRREVLRVRALSPPAPPSPGSVSSSVPFSFPHLGEKEKGTKKRKHAGNQPRCSATEAGWRALSTRVTHSP